MSGKDSDDETDADNTEEEKPKIEKVTIKIPAFWCDRPEVWFAQVEAQFKLAKVKQEATKFNYLMANLEQHIAENIFDLVKSDEKSKYTVAKKRLLSIYKTSEDSKLKQLIKELEMGSYKPTQLLKKMKSLAGDSLSDGVIKSLWLDKLPNYLRNVLLVSDEKLDKLAEIGDRVHELRNVDEVQVSTSNNRNVTHDLGIDELCKKIEQMERKINNFCRNGRSSSRNRDSNFSRSRSRGRYQSNGRYCFYHFRFGQRCRPEKCAREPPCSWNEDSKNENRQQR